MGFTFRTNKQNAEALCRKQSNEAEAWLRLDSRHCLCMITIDVMWAPPARGPWRRCRVRGAGTGSTARAGWCCARRPAAGTPATLKSGRWLAFREYQLYTLQRSSWQILNSPFLLFKIFDRHYNLKVCEMRKEQKF